MTHPMAASSSSSSSAIRRANWTPEEDAILVYYVNIFEPKRWNELAKKSGLQRNGSSCRFRWINYLKSGINTESFTEAEDEKILHLRIQGYQWSQIARELPGRTDNHIKNHYNSHLAKKALKEFQDVCDYSILGDEEFQSFLHEILHGKDYSIPKDVCDYSNPEDEEFQSFLHEILHGKDDDDDDDDNNNN